MLQFLRFTSKFLKIAIFFNFQSGIRFENAGLSFLFEMEVEKNDENDELLAEVDDKGEPGADGSAEQNGLVEDDEEVSWCL